METETIQRPAYVVALSEREVRAALDDPTALQAALRRQLLASHGIEPLQLAPPPAAPKGSRAVAHHKSDGRTFSCGQCEHRPFKTAGFLARHEREAHGA